MLALTSVIQYSSWSNKTRDRHKGGKRNQTIPIQRQHDSILRGPTESMRTST